MKEIKLGEVRANKLFETLQNIDMSKYGFEEGDRVILKVDTDKRKAVIKSYLHGRIEDITELDQKIFEIQEGSGVYELAQTLFKSRYRKTYKALFFILASMTTLKLGIFELCRQRNLYSTRAQFRVLLEHFLKLNYIFFRFIKEQNDNIGQDYEIYADAEDPISLARSISQIQQLIPDNSTGQKSNFFEVLCKLRPKYRYMNPRDVETKVSQFKNFNISKYIINNVLNNTSSTEDKNIRNTLLSIIPDYASFSSYVHGGPSATITSSIECMTKEEEDKCVELATSTLNICVTSLLMACIAFGIVDNKFWEILNKIKVMWEESDAND